MTSRLRYFKSFPLYYRIVHRRVLCSSESEQLQEVFETLSREVVSCIGKIWAGICTCYLLSNCAEQFERLKESSERISEVASI